MKYLLVLLLVACGNTGSSVFDADKPPEIVHPAFTFRVLSDPEQLEPNVRGTATMIDFQDGKRICVVNLREYPKCLLHEIRHCIEGEWHPRDTPNDEDC